MSIIGSQKKSRVGAKAGLTLLLAIACTLLAHGRAGAASSFTALYDFPGSAFGQAPDSRLIFDAAGNLYGTTGVGPNNKGVVFELSPTSTPPWKERVLYSFTGGDDGGGPLGVVFDSGGNLYGTTWFGGVNHEGTLFKLTKGASGQWTETTIWTFGGGNDAAAPNGGLIFDGYGNLFGTSAIGGANESGAIFMFTPSGKESLIYSFCTQGGSRCTDGAAPSPFDSGLILDGSGNLYGTTRVGGNSTSCSKGCGVVFKLTRPANVGSAWTESVLYDFTNGSNDGSVPQGALVFDSSGNLYGTTSQSNTCCGTVFELTPSGGSKWSESLLYKFVGGPNDGSFPLSGLVLDASGSLFGTTSQGGSPSCNCGTLFKLSRTATPPWNESLLYQFTGSAADSGTPFAGLLFDSSGASYGTALGGQINYNENDGAAFQLSGAAFGLKVSVSGQGAVVSAPVGIACTSTCTAIFDPWTIVTLTAKPGNGSVFRGWGGACIGAQPTCTVPIYIAQAVTASFITDTLSVSIGSGGVVTSSPAGINCPGACSANFTPGTPTLVTLTATAKAGYAFTGWGGACGGVDVCAVTMNTNRSVMASFSSAAAHSLSLFLAGDGGGTVASEPSGIRCPGPCGASFASGTRVTLTATPRAGSIFDGWGGACSGAGPTCQVTMSGGENVTASFSPGSYPLSVSVVSGTGGTVASQPSGVSCPGACDASFASGSQVTLTATPESGYAFEGWSGNGACWGTGTCDLTMSSAESLQATFAPVPPSFAPGGQASAIPPTGSSATLSR